jgi:hypothetical protein
MIIGLGIMTWMLVWSWNGTITREYSSPIEISGLYWHFVDIVWIFLFRCCTDRAARAPTMSVQFVTTINAETAERAEILVLRVQRVLRFTSSC